MNKATAREQNKSLDTKPKDAQALDPLEKDFKTTVLNTSKELKEKQRPKNIMKYTNKKRI